MQTLRLAYVSRLVMMVRYGMDLPAELIREQIFSAVDVFVQQDRGSDGQRRVTQIAVRSGALDGGFPYRAAVSWQRQEGDYRWELAPAWVDALPLDGVASEEEVCAWKQQLQLP